ncbi:MAG: hypothetical protein MJY60_04230 [Bacteroidales bacterium]|nr:hypothetical protein [Bacteroidales bacterium]
MYEVTIESRDFNIETKLPVSSEMYELSHGRIFQGEAATINGHHAVTIEGDGVTAEINPDEQDPTKLILSVAGGGGTYAGLPDKPSIGGVTLQGNKTAEQLELQDKINDLATIRSNAQAGAAIVPLVPAQASTTNQLADKNFVNSTVQTGTANFRGNWATLAAVPTDASLYPADYAGNHTPTVNDYMVVQSDEEHDGVTWRYKYSGDWATDGKNGWQAEYEVSETPMTAAQLAAINSGITASEVQRLAGLRERIFIVTRGVTTYQQIVDAKNAGLLPVMMYNNRVFNDVMLYPSAATAYFVCNTPSGWYDLEFVNSNGWHSQTWQNEQTTNKVASLSASSTNTQYPGAKAVYDALQLVNKVFVATYGVTTNQALKDAYNDGKQIICFYSDRLYSNCWLHSNGSVYLSVSRAIENVSIWCDTSNVWHYGNYSFIQSTAKVNSITSASTDEQIPSAKATYDAINPAKQSAIPAGGMLPNVLYDLGELSGAVSMTLAEIVDSTILNHFFCTFETGANVPSLTWDTSITEWYCPFNEAKEPGTKNQAPILSPNKHYEISVKGGTAVAMEV